MKNGMVGLFLSFEKLITLKLVKFIYFAGLVAIVIAGIIGVFKSFGMMGYSMAAGLGGVLLAVLGTAAGILGWRILCELYIVFFGAYERLGEIRDALVDRSGAAAKLEEN